jgi:SAM-dependent methyltransferase
VTLGWALQHGFCTEPSVRTAVMRRFRVADPSDCGATGWRTHQSTDFCYQIAMMGVRSTLLERLRRSRYAGPQRNRVRLSRLLSWRLTGRLLDIGCGDCGFLSFAAEYFDVVGLDAGPGTYRSCLGRRLRLEDVESVDLGHSEYDVVTAFNLLEHLRDPRETIEKVFGALKRNGCLFGSVPYNHLPVGRIHSAVSSFFDRTHRSVFGPRTWLSIFEDAGFVDICVFGELLLGRRALYVPESGAWRYLWCNLMFLCRKPEQAAET